MFGGRLQKHHLFILLWLVYFTSNLGRLSYTACMLDIIDRRILSAAYAGLVGTGFFIWYGLGQIVSGYAGGRLNPYRLVFIGLFCTAAVNAVMGFARTGTFMLVTWCINGLIQSILWPPILRIIVENYPEEERNRVCIHISTTYPVAVMFAYISSAGIVTVFSWRLIFYIYSAFLFIIAGVWVFSYKKIIHAMHTAQFLPAGNGALHSVPAGNQQSKERLAFFGGKSTPGIAIVLFCLALVFQGVLRDGLMAWVPLYVSNVFSFPAGMSILSAGIIPLVNIAGIYLCRYIFARVKDEGKTAFYFFAASFIAALLLRFAGGYHVLISLFAFAVIIACMMGVNLMLVSFVPAGFLRFRLVAFMTGLTNSMVYVGSSVSNFGIALIIEKTGWPELITLIAIMALASAILCAFAAPRWAGFTKYLLQ
ncbi:MAG: MFS transporter [Treponema sp.]|nr:MFS transporter [Treponema sp.]